MQTSLQIIGDQAQSKFNSLVGYVKKQLTELQENVQTIVNGHFTTVMTVEELATQKGADIANDIADEVSLRLDQIMGEVENSDIIASLGQTITQQFAELSGLVGLATPLLEHVKKAALSTIRAGLEQLAAQVENIAETVMEQAVKQGKKISDAKALISEELQRAIIDRIASIKIYPN